MKENEDFSFIFVAVFQCDYEGCVKTFRKNNQLKAHKCEHTNQLPFE